MVSLQSDVLVDYEYKRGRDGVGEFGTEHAPAPFQMQHACQVQSPHRAKSSRLGALHLDRRPLVPGRVCLRTVDGRSTFNRKLAAEAFAEAEAPRTEDDANPTGTKKHRI